MQRRTFLSRTLAGTALLGASSVATARRSRRGRRRRGAESRQPAGNKATSGLQSSSGSYVANATNEVSVQRRRKPIRIDGTIASPDGKKIRVTQTSATLDGAVLFVTLTYGWEYDAASNSLQSHPDPSLEYALDYQVEVFADRMPSDIVVLHNSLDGDHWNTLPNAEIDVSVNPRHMSSGTEQASITVDESTVLVDGTIPVSSSCEEVVLERVFYEDGRLTLSVVVENLGGGSVCTWPNYRKYQLRGSLSSSPNIVVVKHNGEEISRA